MAILVKQIVALLLVQKTYCFTQLCFSSKYRRIIKVMTHVDRNFLWLNFLFL